MVESQTEELDTQRKNAGPALPPCCGTGCAVCVLDYPELFLSDETPTEKSELLALLQAFETAQAEVAGPENEA